MAAHAAGRGEGCGGGHLLYSPAVGFQSSGRAWQGGAHLGPCQLAPVRVVGCWVADVVLGPHAGKCEEDDAARHRQVSLGGSPCEGSGVAVGAWRVMAGGMREVGALGGCMHMCMGLRRPPARLAPQATRARASNSLACMAEGRTKLSGSIMLRTKKTSRVARWVRPLMHAPPSACRFVFFAGTVSCCAPPPLALNLTNTSIGSTRIADEMALFRSSEKGVWLGGHRAVCLGGTLQLVFASTIAILTKTSLDAGSKTCALNLYPGRACDFAYVTVGFGLCWSLLFLLGAVSDAPAATR